MLSGERTNSSFFSKRKPNSLKILIASTPKEGAQERPGDLIPAKLMKFLTSLDSPITKSSNPAIVALSPEKLRMFSLKFIEGTLSTAFSLTKARASALVETSSLSLTSVEALGPTIKFP